MIWRDDYEQNNIITWNRSHYRKEAEAYIAEVEAFKLKQEEYAEEMDRKIVSCINKMSKSDLQQAIYELLCEAPEWLVDKFIYEHIN